MDDLSSSGSVNRYCPVAAVSLQRLLYETIVPGSSGALPMQQHRLRHFLHRLVAMDTRLHVPHKPSPRPAHRPYLW